MYCKWVNPSQQLVKIVHDELVELLGKELKPLNLDGHPNIIMMLGLQGSGKTTSSAKLAVKLKKEGRNPLLVALVMLSSCCNKTNTDFRLSNRCRGFCRKNSKMFKELCKVQFLMPKKTVLIRLFWILLGVFSRYRYDGRAFVN